MSETTPDATSQNTEPERDNPSAANPQTPPAAEGDTAPTEHEPGGMSSTGGTVTDEQLPEDLQATDDNPLAQPLEPDDARGQGMSLGEDGPQP